MGEEVLLHLFLNSVLKGVDGQCHAPGYSPGTHSTGSWVGPRAVPDGYGGQKIYCPYWGSNPGQSFPQQVVILIYVI
jgi:hypothetical protein